MQARNDDEEEEEVDDDDLLYHQIAEFNLNKAGDAV